MSRSAELPSFGESANVPGVAVIPFTSIRPQRATTYEIGTRGRRPDLTWELTGYRAEIKDELLCLYSAFGNSSAITIYAAALSAVSWLCALGLKETVQTELSELERRKT